MYKYKDTKDAYTNDLVMWTDLPEGISNRIPYKVYLVKRKAGSLVEILDENNKLQLYGKFHGFKVLQTKPAAKAVIGDYMYRISSGTLAFPHHTVIKITEVDAELLWYTSTNDVHHDEVIVIAQAEENKQEKEKSYPYFLQGVHNDHPLIVRQDKGSYTYLHIKSEILGKTFKGTHKKLLPCDFTVEPEVGDIDWWQARFKAGLPVYAIMPNGGISLCKGLSPKEWNTTTRFSITGNQSNTTNKIGAQQEPTHPTIKEHPVDKTTLKLLLELLGATEEVKDATNSKFVGIITNEDEYVGYMYFDSKEDAIECMSQPKMELHKLHLFEKSCVLAQKPRKVIEVA